jgi:hypothetical protein
MKVMTGNARLWHFGNHAVSGTYEADVLFSGLYGELFMRRLLVF